MEELDRIKTELYDLKLEILKNDNEPEKKNGFDSHTA